MKVSTLNYQDLTQDIVDKILFDGIEESPHNADCIMVLGSTGAVRHKIPKAVDLYRHNRSPKILVSGGVIRETEYGEISEALAMKIKLLELGIPEDDILVENASSYTIENFLCSSLVLQRTLKLHKMSGILLLTSQHHMRRSLMIAQAYMPNWIRFYPTFSNDTNTLRDNWYTNEKHSKRARDEAYKVVCYIRDGCIADFDV